MWKLDKARYGPKSDPKAWAKHLADLLITLGWALPAIGECVFLKKKLV